MKKYAHILASNGQLTICGIDIYREGQKIKEGVFAQKCPECMNLIEHSWTTISSS